MFSVVTSIAGAQETLDFLQFQIPAKQYYPETWFHFVGGNVSKPDITADLEALANAGFKGVQLFHGKIGDGKDWPGTTEHIECLSPQWEGLVKHTATEAHRLGLDFTMQTCPGWATSGGPWIKPEQAMRNVVCTQIRTSQMSDLLSKPLPLNHYAIDQDYKDIALIAFPTPLGDCDHALCEKTYKGEEANFQPTTESNPHIIDFNLEKPEVARTLVMRSIDAFNHNYGPAQHISIKMTAFVNGKELTIAETPLPYSNWQDSNDTYPLTLALDERGATNHYRLYIVNRHPMIMTWVKILTAARKSNWTAEAGFTLRSIVRANENPQQDKRSYIQKEDITVLRLPLTLAAVEELRAKAQGKPYTLLRIGHVNKREKNSPAPDEATGWEVDKYNAEAVDFQFQSYIGRLNQGALKGLINNMLLDSWECGTQTWTPRMEAEFKRVAGYELANWLPTLFGYVIDNPNTTSTFLSDWRRTQNDLFVNVFFKRMVSNAHSLGMNAYYETAAGDIFPGDPLEYYKWADIPMCEFWQPFGHFLADHNYKPIRPTASAARMYGKKRVAAESFTSLDLTWDEHLQMLRDVANQNMAEGVSHLVFHTYTHNPGADNHKPGSSFGGNIGSPFLRNQTWWPYMKEFTSYLARCSYMLEAGKPVSQVLWYLGDEIQQKPDQYTAFPEGFMFDYCNHDALMTRITVKDGKWMTPEGISYDVMWIPERGRLLPETIERLLELVRKGGILLADKPLGNATLSTEENLQERYTQSVRALWNEQRVYPASYGFQAFAQPDVLGIGNRWCHRQTADNDIYFVCPLPEKSFRGEVSFRSTGKAEIWDAVTGTKTPLKTTIINGRSYANLELPEAGSVFVVFSHQGAADSTPAKQVTNVIPIDQTWTLDFPSGWGIEAPVRTRDLLPWCELPISDEAKAFSGTVSYTTIISLNSYDKNSQYMLSLGEVDMTAEVLVNGQSIAKLWTSPFKTDISTALHKGKNRLEIRVTSSWHNRLVYDACQPEDRRKTWVIHGPAADTPLKRYGLLGPVAIEVRK